MMDKLIFGRYIPGDSLIHRLDPRTKLLGAIWFIIIIFLANNWISYAALVIFVLTAVKLTQINPKFFINGVKPLIWLILFTVILQILFTSGQTIWLRFGPIVISQEGVLNGVFIFLRFVLIIFMSTILTLTTMPLSLTDAIEFLLRPFAAIRMPVHEIALMLSIALRFVPTLMDETEKIMNAQRARGIDFGEGNIYQQMKSIVPLLIPLFVSSFNRAEELATAMEARGYKGGEGRTKYRQLSWEGRDTAVMLAFAALSVVLFILRT
ncbi:MAG: energy-coupling factor transporter transmembrane protein EcfT [Alkalibacterium sp.]|uniref:Energy-coupling factor transporter transmembrane protein EcfT n=1 Tax=Alkalibacterium gilvum TaxID=1130080 RepID=A0A1H6V0Q0_9LACT|nr:MULTISPECIES: energy-coupling factor transporter transmembrane component T [Alkalibacterium]MDN6293562.1 energy-coupling factor transporter transmembrane protein EcfT [Alkalibacterium sp.]MDN6296283.1 energy-coupling factor transporter transmembrane protein EcfT [Alkalibacterium sp.]MDN6385576.1 energy-coupling factor transporter transmembrane protein EcfT [Alkalibacterium sp.]SEI93822.1 energy-coupling factor transport system permease protein [Alkalibacterium gilvum]HAJ70207.1 energy-coupl